MGISQTPASVNVGRTKAGNNLLHVIFNRSGDSGVDSLREANPHGVKDLTKYKRRLFNVKPDCGPCHLGKQSRAAFYRHTNKPNIRPLDIVSTDTAGPFPTTTADNKYLQFIIDRASKKTAAIPLKSKSAATDNIKNTIAAWQHLLGNTVTRYHSDNEKVLQAKTLVDSLKTQGNSVTSTVSHSSQQNPDAERVVRTITDVTRCALQSARMST